MHAGYVGLALGRSVQEDIIWYAVIAVVFVLGVIFAIRSN
jgi:hypothetical protein